MTRLGFFAVVLVVVLAGCGGGLSGTETPADAGQPDGELTETAAPPTASPTPDVAFPAGLSREGVENTSELLAAHDSALGTDNLTVSMDFTLEVNGEGRDVSFTGKITPSDQRGWMQIVLEDGIGTYYNEAGVTYANITQNGESTYGKEYDVSALPRETRFGADKRIRDAIDAATWSFDGLVEREGKKLQRFTASDVSLPDSVDVDSENVTAESAGVLLVDEDGIVHHVSIESQVETPDKTVTYGISVTISDIGTTTIERPDWFYEARDG